MKVVKGGVCAAKGFFANGVHCGIRKNKDKKDLCLIYSDVLANAAAVYTQNKVKGAPLLVCKEHLKEGKAKAIICNSGNANTCNANGVEIANEMCQILAKSLKIKEKEVLVASTGVIGQPLSIEPIKLGIPPLIAGLCNNSSAAAEAIMTTDTIKKEIALEFDLSGKLCHIGGIAKGSGMIHPNMATMLVFITSDVAISSEMLQKALYHDVQSSFNMISVDGDTSTNDFVCILANGLAGNEEIVEDNEDFAVFMKALNSLTVHLCRAIAGDGEGATKLLECQVKGAKTLKDAKLAAKSVISSSLFKAAMFGADANWGRVLCAMGYSGADLDMDKIDLCFVSKAGSIELCKNGKGLDFSEEQARNILSENEISIIANLNQGNCFSFAWGCDLSYDYVKINGDYRT